jgi:hypothetical protein
MLSTHAQNPFGLDSIVSLELNDLRNQPRPDPSIKLVEPILMIRYENHSLLEYVFKDGIKEIKILDLIYLVETKNSRTLVDYTFYDFEQLLSLLVMRQAITCLLADIDHYLETRVLLPAIHIERVHLVSLFLKVTQDKTDRGSLTYARHAMYENIPPITACKKRLDARSEIKLLALPTRKKLRQEIIIQRKLIYEKRLVTTQTVFEQTHHQNLS